MMLGHRKQYEDLGPTEKAFWEGIAYERFTEAGHSFHPVANEEFRTSEIARMGKSAWQQEHMNRLERFSNGWFGMKWSDHKKMFVNNYIGHRNAQTYMDGPKFYIPPRRGPWLKFLRWLQVIPPRPLKVKDVADIIDKKPWNEGK